MGKDSTANSEIRESLDAHASNEKDLLASAKQAADLITSATDNNAALSEKVVKLQTFQHRNEGKTVEYTSKVQGDMKTFCSQLTYHQTVLQVSFDSAQKALKNTQEDASLKSAELTKMCTSLQKWLTQQIDELQRVREPYRVSLLHDCTERETWHAEHSTSLKRMVNDLRDRLS